MSVSVVVMAHPSRRAFVSELLESLDRPAEVVWDRCQDRWETGRRSLLAHLDHDCEWALTIQDDAIVPPDLVAGVERAVELGARFLAGEHPLCLYVGSPVSAPAGFTELVTRARQLGAPWFRETGPLWGVAIALPTAHIPDLVAAMDERREIPNYDARIAKFYRTAGIDCLYTLPSLVDHRPVSENPSLVAGRTANRRARAFIGAERSALSVDFARPPVPPTPTRRFRHRRSGREESVETDSERHRRLARNRLWEAVDGAA